MESKLNKSWKTKFFSIWIGQAFSLLGSQIVQFSLIWYLTQKTGSVAVLATSTLVSLLPSVLLSPFIGALVDRLDRKRIMLIADIAIATVTLALVLLFRFELIQVWHIYLAIFLRELGSTFHWPSMQSSSSLLIPKNQISKIAGLNQALRGVLNVIGPPFAALLLETLPIQRILAIDIITAMLAITPLLFVTIPQPKKEEDEEDFNFFDVVEDVKFGFRYLWDWRGIFLLALIASLLNFFITPSFNLFPLLITEHFNGGAIELSLVESIFGIGVILGGVLLTTWGGFKRQVNTTLSAVIGMGLGTIIIAISPGNLFNLALAGVFIVGVMNPIANGSLSAIMQTNVAPEVQGRVFTTFSSMTGAMAPIAMILATPVESLVGIRGWFYIGGIGCTLMGIIGFLNHHIMGLESNNKNGDQAHQS